MSFIQTVTERNVRINNVYRSRGGGLITYIFLYFKLWKMLFWGAEVFSFWQKIKLSLLLVLKSPYWLLIKPWGYFFSTKRTFKGEYKLRNEQLVSSSVKKIYCLKFLFIPIFFFISKPNDDDWEELLSD